MYYNKEGEKITVEEFGKLLREEDYKFIKQEELKDGKFLSTVWLGHGFEKKGKSLIFETMLFSKKGDWSDIDCKRYSTLEEAKKGHEEMKKKYEK
jgi:hypothetical protein